MRVLGVDFGRARIGIAVGETEAGVASPRAPLPASGTLARDAQALVALARREEAERVVLGLPLSQGGETPGSRIVRRLGAEVERLGVAVAYVDESLTSAEAEAGMDAAGLTGAQKRRRVDGLAASAILERYFSEHASPD